MKLWIANFFTTDRSPTFDVQGFLVRARDLSECAYAAEEHLRTHPGLLADQFERYVSSALELPQHAPGEDSAVLFGPVSLLSVCGTDAIYWRRDEGDPFWVVEAMKKATR